MRTNAIGKRQIVALSGRAEHGCKGSVRGGEQVREGERKCERGRGSKGKKHDEGWEEEEQAGMKSGEGKYGERERGR